MMMMVMVIMMMMVMVVVLLLLLVLLVVVVAVVAVVAAVVVAAESKPASKAPAACISRSTLTHSSPFKQIRDIALSSLAFPSEASHPWVGVLPDSIVMNET